MTAAIACAATMASAAGASTVAGSVAGWVKSATLIGAAPADKPVTIAVHMALQNTAGLKQLVEDLSSPTSEHYGRYLTKEEFGARFAPAAADVDAVQALLEHAGMADVAVGPHGVYVSATATVTQLRATFKVTQNLYSYKGMTLRANTEDPTIPAALAGKVLFIEGLDDTDLMRTPYHRSVTMGTLAAPAAAASAVSATTAVTPPPVYSGTPSPYCNTDFGAHALVATLSTAADVYGAAIPWLNCGYTPQQIQAAYGLSKINYTGQGVTVAIVDAYASPTLLADSNRYAANHDLPKLVTGNNFSQIIPLGIYDVSPKETCGPYGWWEEQSLDMAAVHGAAPGANILYVGSRNCGTSLSIAFENTVYNHLADIVTNSYGNGGEAIAPSRPGSQAAFDQAAMAGAAQGMTVLFSSGDGGDLAAANGVASGSWPATSAYVTGVGGTTLLLKDASGAKAEYGWGAYRAYLADAKVKSAKSVTTSGVETTSAYGYTYDDYAFYGGSGGGISLLEKQPSYQATAVPRVLATTLNLASGYTETLPSRQRVSPDVAMDADPYTGYLVGETYTILSAPADPGCTALSATKEYCEVAYGGTSVSSPLMAGVMAVMNQKRNAGGQPLVGFANPLLYSLGSRGNGANFTTAPLNQITAPPEPTSVLRGYAGDPTKIRVVTINSVPFNITTGPYPNFICAVAICEGLDEQFNWTSLSSQSVPPTPAGYNDVTGLGVPYVPRLIYQE